MIEGNLLISDGKKITVLKSSQNLDNCSMFKKIEFNIAKYKEGKLVSNTPGHFYVLQNSVTNPADKK